MARQFLRNRIFAMKSFILLTICLAAVAQTALGRVFTKCELAHELLGLGFEKENLPDWICLVESESSFSTTDVSGPNTNGSFDWGLFQINDGYWCLVGEVGNDCNMDCNDLIDDDISDDVVCVRKIFGRHGWLAWHGWEKKCMNKPLPDLSSCFE